MRNLKKFLALVLAMVMAMSLMVTANAATKSSAFPDEDIDEHFVEAVDVLYGLKVFQGQNATGAEDGEKTFAPKASITRKEVAALMYRIFSTDVADARDHLYKDYGNFTDVNSESWYAGYVGLCANQEIIKGSNNGRFYPDENVTGYQVLAMILRMVGYDQNHEFEGTDWRINVAGYATKLHITDNFNESNYDRTLNEPATREVVAELIFQTMVRVPMVEYRLGNYDDKVSLTDNSYRNNLGQEKFGLTHGEEWQTDDWGVPYYSWYQGGVKTGVGQDGWAIWDYSNAKNIAKVYPDPDMDFTVTMRECDVAEALKYDGSKYFDLYVNSDAPVNETLELNQYRIEATDTVTRVGGQGRHTQIWYNLSSKWFSETTSRVVMIDTYLAQVTRVTPVVLDHNEHVVQYAQADLVVYDRGEAMPGSDRTNDRRTGTGTDGDGTDDKDPINFINDDTYGTRCTNLTKGAYRSEHTMTKSDKSNYDYTVGQYILVQGKTDPSQGNDWTSRVNSGVTVTGTNIKTGLNHTIDQAAMEKMAFETNMLFANDRYAKLAPVDGIKALEAKQSSVSWNNGTHNVGGESKPDQLTLFMDYAGSNLSNTFTWYFDQYNNVIGIGPKANSVKYGVITSLYASFGQGSASTNGKAQIIADVQFADKTTDSLVISEFIVTGTNYNAGRGKLLPTTNRAPDGDVNPYGLAMTDHEGATNGTNTVDLLPIYDYANLVDIMTAQGRTGGWTAATGTAEFGGELAVAPVASINAQHDVQDATHFGIIYDNLFKFITTESGVVTAIEIAGSAPRSASQDNTNSLRYDGHYHFQNSDNAAYVGKLSKSQGNITTEQLKAGNTNGAPVWLDKNVKIILNRNKSLTVYNGLDELPSDITIDADTEVDYVDVNGDLRADYVYLYGETTGAVTYGLFYYNGGNAVWNGTTGTLTGWLNGTENTTLTFNSEALFSAVRNSANYYGHMFAVRMMDGKVDDLFMTDDDHALNGTGWTYNILWDNGTTNANGEKIHVGDVDAAGSADMNIAWGVDTTGNTNKGGFKTGVLGGNPYDGNTWVAYYSEGRGTPASSAADGAANTDDVTYYRSSNQVYGTVTVNAGTGGTPITYYVGANTKYYGIGMGAVHGEAILEYLNKSPRNDVTIVYDATNNGILEIYVATDPNITPTTPGNTDPVYSVDVGDLTMQLTDDTLSFTNTTGFYKKDGIADATAHSAATNAVRATFYAENNLGQWETIGTYSKTSATTSSAVTSGILTLDSITVTSLARGVTYRVTVEVNLGHGWVTVVQNVPIGRAD